MSCWDYYGREHEKLCKDFRIVWQGCDRSYGRKSCTKFYQNKRLWYIVSSVGDGDFGAVRARDFGAWCRACPSQRYRYEERVTQVLIGVGAPDDDGEYEEYRHVGFTIPPVVSALQKKV